MSKCPKCSKEISLLRVNALIPMAYDFELDENGSGKYENGENSQLIFGAEFACPECGELLFTAEHDASLFLAGLKK